MPDALEYAAAARVSKIIFVDYFVAAGLNYLGQLAQAARAKGVLMNLARHTPVSVCAGRRLRRRSFDTSICICRNQEFRLSLASENKTFCKGNFPTSPGIMSSPPAVCLRQNYYRDDPNEEAVNVFLDFFAARQRRVGGTFGSKAGSFGRFASVKNLDRSRRIRSPMRRRLHNCERVRYRDGKPPVIHGSEGRGPCAVNHRHNSRTSTCSPLHDGP